MQPKNKNICFFAHIAQTHRYFLKDILYRLFVQKRAINVISYMSMESY